MPARQPSGGGGGAGTGTSEAAGAAAAAAWDPWDRVPPGKTKLTSKEYLQTEFTVTSCGGLKCNTCRSFTVLKMEVESKSASEVSGILTNHLNYSDEHKAAVAGQKNEAKAKGLYAFMGPKPAAGSEAEGGEAAAPSSALAS